jgi:hypothetical protein
LGLSGRLELDCLDGEATRQGSQVEKASPEMKNRQI